MQKNLGWVTGHGEYLHYSCLVGVQLPHGPPKQWDSSLNKTLALGAGVADTGSVLSHQNNSLDAEMVFRSHRHCEFSGFDSQLGHQFYASTS